MKKVINICHLQRVTDYKKTQKGFKNFTNQGCKESILNLPYMIELFRSEENGYMSCICQFVLTRKKVHEEIIKGEAGDLYNGIKTAKICLMNVDDTDIEYIKK